MVGLMVAHSDFGLIFHRLNFGSGHVLLEVLIICVAAVHLGEKGRGCGGVGIVDGSEAGRTLRLEGWSIEDDGPSSTHVSGVLELVVVKVVSYIRRTEEVKWCRLWKHVVDSEVRGFLEKVPVKLKNGSELLYYFYEETGKKRPETLMLSLAMDLDGECCCFLTTSSKQSSKSVSKQAIKQVARSLLL